MVHRSHASCAGPQPGAAPRPHAQPNGLLALQRSAGNRAVRALLARDKDPDFKPGVIQIGGERVRVASKAEKAGAERIVGEMKSRYGVTFDSIAAQRTTRKHYGDMDAATHAQLKSVEARPGEHEELKAVERALGHFGPADTERRPRRPSPPAGMLPCRSVSRSARASTPSGFELKEQARWRPLELTSSSEAGCRCPSSVASSTAGKSSSGSSMTPHAPNSTVAESRPVEWTAGSSNADVARPSRPVAYSRTGRSRSPSTAAGAGVAVVLGVGEPHGGRK